MSEPIRTISPRGTRHDAFGRARRARRLFRERLAARNRIAAAELADEQSAATRTLQVSYEEAWGRMLEIDMPGPETADLLAVLGDPAAAYRAMATASSSGDQSGYDEARAVIYEAEDALWSEPGAFAS